MLHWIHLPRLKVYPKEPDRKDYMEIDAGHSNDLIGWLLMQPGSVITVCHVVSLPTTRNK